jgi:uncharacterized membrane protein
MKSQRVVRSATASVVAVLAAGAMSEVAARAASPKSETLVYAVYDGQDTATNIFKTMKSNQKATGERIESYAVVSMDLKGKVTVRDQRRKDAGVGAIIGGVIGLVGGPIGVAVGATTGGAFGYLTGDAVGIPTDKVQSMKSSLTPDTSALVVVLEDKWVADVEKDMDKAHARAVIANQIAGNQQ